MVHWAMVTVCDDRSHPGSGASNGLKHALVTSRNSRSVLPPSLVRRGLTAKGQGILECGGRPLPVRG
jgi:hypothetical protein